MKNKYSFQEIDNETRDSYLRTSQVFDERDKLRDNWNSLRDFVTLKEKPKVFGAKNGKTLELGIDLAFDMVLDKMNELEKRNENWLYGGKEYKITKKEIEALLKGEKLYGTINDEYAFTIELEGDNNENNS